VKLHRDGVAQAGDAIEPGVDIMALAYCLDGGLLDRCRNRRVADALGEVDAANAIALDTHGADFGLQNAGSKMAERERRSDCGVGVKTGRSVNELGGHGTHPFNEQGNYLVVSLAFEFAAAMHE
jgi:hypothetical protein